MDFKGFLSLTTEHHTVCLEDRGTRGCPKCVSPQSIKRSALGIVVVQLVLVSIVHNVCRHRWANFVAPWRLPPPNVAAHHVRRHGSSEPRERGFN